MSTSYGLKEAEHANRVERRGKETGRKPAEDCLKAKETESIDHVKVYE